MNKKDGEGTKRLCSVCFKREVKSLNMCIRCKNMDMAIFKLVQEAPKQAHDYLKRVSEKASKAVRNRYMSKAVGT